MGEYALEFRLVGCLLINAMVFGAGYIFSSRKITTSRSQAALDAVLTGYTIQYAAVGLPGVLGLLYPSVVTVIALVFAATLIVFSFRSKSKLGEVHFDPQSIVVMLIAVFAGGFALAYVHSQAVLPVFFNDALTYHFPAAVQWAQDHRIGIYQPWFFNPANAYSPLAGSVFIEWLTVPFGGDAVSRFVEVPPLLAIGIAVYRLGREIGATPVPAALSAAAAVCCRPLFLQSMMGKDDLFVVLFLLAGLVGLSRRRAAEPWGWTRVGLAVGLMLAVKVTAALAVPTLLLAVDSPRLNWRRWIGAAATAGVVAGPWYLRNWIAAGNPLFPLRIGRAFPGLFTTARSTQLAVDGLRFVIGGSYSIPLLIAVLLAVCWLATLVVDRTWWRRPLTRASVLGPPIGIAVFYFRSPFPEVRFITPFMAVLFALCGATLSRFFPWKWATAAAAVLAAASVATAEMIGQLGLVIGLVGIAVAAALIVTGLAVLAKWLPPARRAVLVYAPLTAVFAVIVFVYWAAYVRGCRESLYLNGSAYGDKYSAEFSTWKFVDEHVPPDATVAYTNLYLVYPLMGPEQRRHLVYVPTRDGIESMASLPYLGNGLSGEQVVTNASAETVASPDAQAWMKRLDRSGATYLIVGLGDGFQPPELAMATALPTRFAEVFHSGNAVVFEIRK